jgi:hypothetical protein
MRALTLKRIPRDPAMLGAIAPSLRMTGVEGGAALIAR